MDKTYQPHAIEQKWAQTWEEHGYYQPSGHGQPYSIMLPPPNVTGTLHMGHGFQHALMDALIRQHRMMGDNTLWQCGTDHAGIATQMVVERQLAAQNQSRHDLGREAFIQKTWEWREQSGHTITRQIRRLGNSLDWSRERFSMDPVVTKATYEAFIRLYDDELIYRGKRLVNWDPKLGTAISDLEVATEPEEGHLWYIRYPIAGQDGHLVVATTRPETLLGDTGVAVHPEDERYRHLIGEHIQLPLTDRQIPIVADDAVDPEFGTGCVKVTPAHDFNDYEIGKRHQLPMITVLNFDATMNDQVPEAYRGLTREAARKQVVADLETAGLLEKIEKYQHNVPRGDRSGVIVEPMLTDQWYVKAAPLAEKAMAVVRDGSMKLVPSKWEKTYFQWLENIQDWCISRQLWWGHRIPVWYDEQGNTYVGHNENDARSRNQLGANVKLSQDEDVLDTWFTAALWPFSSLGWPDQTDALQTFYPSSVLITGFDIIFFWVARMVMMGLYFLDDVPFKDVYITGLIRDAHGQKMSKSKGNILDPIDLIDGIELEPLITKRTAGLMQPKMAQKIEKETRKEFPEGIASYGTDALRFTFCALASTGRDINFDMGRIEGYRNFCNKLWNAARFVIMNTEQHSLEGEFKLSPADLWIRSQLQHTIKDVLHYFKNYRFDLLAQCLYEFTWNQYCDWYLEFVKVVLNDDNADAELKLGARRTLLEVLETLLRLMHPLMPFITEEIWQKVAHLLEIEDATIMMQTYPKVDAKQIDQATEQDIEWLKNVIASIRNIRGEMNVAPSKKIDILLNKGTEQDQQRIEKYSPSVKMLARVTKIDWHPADAELPASATAIIDSMEVHIPLAGLIDKDAEMSRIQKEMEKLQKDYDKSQKKLGNPSYVDKAPAEVVAKERDRLAQAENTLKKLQAHYDRIANL